MNSRIGSSELIDLLVSFVVLTIAFSLIRGGLTAETLLISAIGVGTGFMLHELAHKFMAQRYGYWAEYKMNLTGLLLTLGMAFFFGFVFAAPGAVMIRKMSQSSQPMSTYSYGDDSYWDSIDRRSGKEEGKIAAAGPVTNLILAGFFFAVIMTGLITDRLLISAAYYAMFINISLAAFNMIPIDPFDGAKILRSSVVMWAVIGLPAIFLALALMFAPQLILNLF